MNVVVCTLGSPVSLDRGAADRAANAGQYTTYSRIGVCKRANAGTPAAMV